MSKTINNQVFLLNLLFLYLFKSLIIIFKTSFFVDKLYMIINLIIIK